MPSHDSTIDGESTVAFECTFTPGITPETTPFWIGLFKEGDSLKPENLFELDSIQKALDIASEKTIDCNTPLLLSDTKSSSTNYVLLCPCLGSFTATNAPGEENKNQISFMEQLESAIDAAQPISIGIDLRADFIDYAFFAVLIHNLIKRHFKKETPYLKRIFLTTTKDKYPEMLNGLYQIKAELGRESIPITVNH